MKNCTPFDDGTWYLKIVTFYLIIVPLHFNFAIGSDKYNFSIISCPSVCILQYLSLFSFLYLPPLISIAFFLSVLHYNLFWLPVFICVSFILFVSLTIYLFLPDFLGVLVFTALAALVNSQFCGFYVVIGNDYFWILLCTFCTYLLLDLDICFSLSLTLHLPLDIGIWLILCFSLSHFILFSLFQIGFFCLLF